MNNPPTTVEGVTVTGQRRHETQPFPVMPPAVPVPLFPENSATIGPDTEYEYLEPCDIALSGTSGTRMRQALRQLTLSSITLKVSVTAAAWRIESSGLPWCEPRETTLAWDR